jgi:hypothetical protein
MTHSQCGDQNLEGKSGSANLQDFVKQQPDNTTSVRVVPKLVTANNDSTLVRNNDL